MWFPMLPAMVTFAGIVTTFFRESALRHGEKGDKVARNRGILRIHKFRPTFAKPPGEHSMLFLLH